MAKRSPRSKASLRSILFGVTNDHSLILLKGFPQHLAMLGWEVHVVSAPGRNLDELGKVPGVTVHEIPMLREPSFCRDLRGLMNWFLLLRRVKPKIISVGTPKAALLGIMAGFLVRVPIRVYVLRGLRSETAQGLSKIAYIAIERLVCVCASQVICVSPSLRELALRYNLASGNKLRVLGGGSSNGVETGVATLTAAARSELQARIFPGPRRPIIGFIGRITQDKGLDVLAAAMRLLTQQDKQGDCIVIGGDDGSTGRDLRAKLDASGWRIVYTGHVDRIADVAQVMDMLCLPSLREGFPNVVLEAAVLGIACVGSDATGVRDAIVHGETGLISKRGDAESLAAQLELVFLKPGLPVRLGAAAKKYASKYYARGDVWAIHSNFYNDLVVAGGEPKRSAATVSRAPGTTRLARRDEAEAGTNSTLI